MAQSVTINVSGIAQKIAPAKHIVSRWMVTHGKKSMRKKNPVSLSQAAKIARAAKLFEEFTGDAPEFIDKMKVKFPTVALKVGKCDGILYTTVRDGKEEKYIHEFKKNSRPLLAFSYDGETILLLGGAFDFTDRGIVDRE